jgi:fimbrial chaperone protein
MLKIAFRLAAAALLCAGLFTPALASAATFQVSPLSLNISTFGDVTVTNTSGEPIRFSINAKAWSQTPAESEHKEASDQIAFFPQVFSLDSGASQRIRVSLATPPGPSERSYRLFISELPPFNRKANGQRLLILSRIDIPVFQPPAQQGAPTPHIDRLAVSRGNISALVANYGNTHIAPSHISLRALNASGAVMWSNDAEVWYVLAQSKQLATARVPANICENVRSISTSWNVNGNTVSKNLAIPAGACR